MRNSPSITTIIAEIISTIIILIIEFMDLSGLFLVGEWGTNVVTNLIPLWKRGLCILSAL